MDMDYEKSCQTCKYRDIFHEDICHACDYKYSCWEPDIPSSPDDLIEMYEIKQRAEKDYKDALFVYANCPVGTAGRNEAEKKCDIYEVRPWICQRFICNSVEPKTMQCTKNLKPVNMCEIFK